MHTKSELVEEALALVKEHWSVEKDGPLLCYPDDMPHRKKAGEEIDLNNIMDTQTFVDHCVEWRRKDGVRILGGCCGITSSHIAALTGRFAKEKILKKKEE